MKLKETLTMIDRPKLHKQRMSRNHDKIQALPRNTKMEVSYHYGDTGKKLHERQQKITFDDYGAPDIINIKLRRDLVQG